MSVRVLSRVWDHAQVDSTRLIVLLAIADNANDDGVAWPSAQTIADKTRLKVRAARKAIADLVAAGELEVLIPGGTGAGATTVWLVASGISDAARARAYAHPVLADLTPRRTRRRVHDTTPSCVHGSAPSEGCTPASSRVHDGALSGCTSASRRVHDGAPEPSVEPSGEPSPEPRAPRLPSSSHPRRGDDQDDDGEHRHVTIDEAYRIVARRRLDDRDRAVARHGGPPIPPGPRRDRWIARDVEHSRAGFDIVAAAYLADDPSLTGEQLADLLAPDLLDDRQFALVEIDPAWEA